MQITINIFIDPWVYVYCSILVSPAHSYEQGEAWAVWKQSGEKEGEHSNFPCKAGA